MKGVQRRVVIVGGGAGGAELTAAVGRRAVKKKMKISLVDCASRHLWKPRLHEVAARVLGESEDAIPYLAPAQANGFRFHLGALFGLNASAKTISIGPVLTARGGSEAMGVGARLVRVAVWRGASVLLGRRRPAQRERKGVDVSAAPVLHFESDARRAFFPYREASVGLHLLSDTRINEERQFSTAFQFGEFLGVGAKFGENRQYDVAVRIEHVSNGGIKKPNDGLTYAALVIQYQFMDR
jgi:hypothetical protein